MTEIREVTVGAVLVALEERFPLAWAFDWDHVGLRVGDPAWRVTRVLVTLDATPAALRRAIDAGCQMLVTHHPPFLESIETLTPSEDAGAFALAAAHAGVAVVSMHTNLDRAPEGSGSLPPLFGMDAGRPLEPDSDDNAALPPGIRLGRLCEIAPTSLEALATVAGAALGVRPRVWGDPAKVVRVVAVGTGSVRSLIPAALAAGADVLLGGEVRYHDALDAVGRGLAIIEAGHDATEWPLVHALADVAREVLGEEGVVEEPAQAGWWIAEGA